MRKYPLNVSLNLTDDCTELFEILCVLAESLSKLRHNVKIIKNDTQVASETQNKMTYFSQMGNNF